MSSKRARRRDLKKVSGEEYDPRVLLVACPRCEKGVGERCISVSQSWIDYATERELKKPHPDRVALARGPL